MRKFTKLAAVVAAMALMTTASATAGSLITGKDIANGTITNADVKKGSLKANRLSKKARASLRGQRGPQGERGPAGQQGETGAAGTNGTNGTNGADGAKGDKGDTGDRGPSNVFTHTSADKEMVDNATRTIATQNLGAGTYLVTARFAASSTNNGQLDCRLRNGIASDRDILQVDLVAGDRELVHLQGTITVAEGAGGFNDDARVVCFGEGVLGATDMTEISVASIQVGATAATSE